jgi:hypothetical protein
MANNSTNRAMENPALFSFGQDDQDDSGAPQPHNSYQSFSFAQRDWETTNSGVARYRDPNGARDPSYQTTIFDSGDQAGPVPSLGAGGGQANHHYMPAAYPYLSLYTPGYPTAAHGGSRMVTSTSFSYHDYHMQPTSNTLPDRRLQPEPASLAGPASYIPFNASSMSSQYQYLDPVSDERLNTKEQRAKKPSRRRKTAVEENAVKADYTFGAKFNSGLAAITYLESMVRRVDAGEQDDHITVAADFLQHSKELFDGLTQLYSPWPSKYGEAYREPYKKAQDNATQRITARMSTVALCELAEARVAATVAAVVDVHSHGVPAQILGRSGPDTEEDMTCSERMTLVIKAVKENKLVAEAVINGDFADLVRAPKEVLQRKLDNARGNADKKRKFELAKTIDAPKKRGRRSKPKPSSPTPELGSVPPSDLEVEAGEGAQIMSEEV